ncbi:MULTISPECIES: shikimate dehydrogenase [unclassified Peribacillus]|uniref:shikimate dehydrogenase n=1 Tax=unclassified Peribacillus TaxID=2675266 RepID=UPI001F4E7B58|nr:MULTISPECIES: shikimate dehydrogenase [unclassified Peribacillus]MCK1986033.1 shikimate dehydrogenase [Peribacillus sp. Aquil_B1]MCK2011256.1 shikimate dehydrogenase [Peribacillus sp. Aquil_B8]
MKELFGIIGNPIGHSLSPLIQNESYELHEINAHFQAFHVEHEDLESAIKGMKAIGIKGFMVTVPFKAEVIPFLDEVDPIAEKKKAVNVVQLIDGKYVGFNFDGEGCLKALLEDMNRQSLQNENILILGAGGAAQSIFYTLSHFDDVHIDLANRTIEKAEALKELGGNHRHTSVISLEEAEIKQNEYDIIIQTTSIGMWPDIDQSPINITNLKKGAFVSDIIYNPAETKILKQARENGANTQNGIKMLAFQNALSIEKWTGQKVNYQKMIDSLTKALR